MPTKPRVLERTILPAAFFFLFSSSEIQARMMVVDTAQPSFSKLAGITALPNLEQCTHKTGRLWFTITNYGILGNRKDALLRDCVTGGFTSSAEYPGGSGVEYLFQGGLWIGGMVGTDTLTSIGTDGWLNIRELFPDAGTRGSIIQRSKNSASPFYGPDAVSDQDFIAVYYDTLKDPRLVTNPDPENGRPHKPMGLKIEQRSYSWVASWGQDWVLLDYTITNLGEEPIKKAHFGFFIDPDIGDARSDRATHLDDYSAYKDSTFLKLAGGNFNPLRNPKDLICAETLHMAYAYDNDGDPETGNSLTGALGVRFLRAKEAIRLFSFPAKVAFNWWIADSLGLLDWGPQRTPGRTSIYGHRGQPVGDAMRYHYLSNQETDYDQIYGALSPSTIANELGLDGDWLPPLQPQISALDIAGGADSRFLLSTGPFELGIGESVPLTVAVFVGPRFHFDPANFENNFPDPADFLDPARIAEYRSRLDLRGLVESSRLARKVFDNENIVSPVLCLGGLDPVFDSTRAHGDGIPDFKGPLPPPYPKIEFLTAEGEVTIRWFGKETENAIDPVTGVKDFEGYTVYMSPDGVNFTIIGYFDKINRKVYYLNRDLNQNGLEENWEFRWEPARMPPQTYEEIQNYLAIRWDTCANKPGNITKPIDPRKFSSSFSNRSPVPFIPSGNPWCNPDTAKTAIRVRFCDACSPRFGSRVDTVFYFGEPEGLNLGLDKIRMYPSVTDPNNDSAYWYQFKISSLLPSQPLWFSVAPFDNGLRTFYERVDPQEAAPFAGRHQVYAVAGDSARLADGLKVSVYPNPYRIDHNYSYFEKKLPVSGHPQSSQRINFINLPPRCIIRIYTLDGDLVQQINHDKNPDASDSGYDFWDLLSRNAQKVAAGMYLFTVESAEGRYIGKILIIQ